MQSFRELGLEDVRHSNSRNFLPCHEFVQQLFESEVDLKVIATAIDGFEALQKAIELRPDVILMDLSLPGMNGLEATRHIRILRPASKILFLSEDRGCELIEVAFQVGGFGYILKSDSHSDLLIGIRAVLRGQRFVSRSLTDLLNLLD